MKTEPTIEELYLREVADSEVRAKRTLRVFQHQNERLATMEKDLSTKFNSLKDLQDDHSELLEVHHYQKEVQDLQRELIKLQEIQYLTEFTNIMDEDDPSQSQCTEMTRSLKDVPPSNALPIHAPTPQASSQIILKPQFSSDKSIGNEFSGNNPRCLPSVRNSINSLQSLLEFIKGSVAKANRVSSEQDEFAGDETKIAPSSSGMDSKDAIICVKTGSGHKRQKASDSGIGSKDYDEDKEKIVLLRETLSSHRDSIEALSAEVIELRKERIELIDHLNDLLSWRMQMEKMMSEAQSEKHDADFAKEMHSAAVKSMTNIIMSPTASSSIQCDRYSDNYKKDCSPTCSQEDCCKKTGKLESRAYRMWTTACKFFTPQEAHFILTAPVPPEEMESDDDDEI